MEEGFLLIDKPAGMTSHDVIDALRRLTGLRQIGHAGTLDPFATGLLIVGVGKATKKLSSLVGLDKTYEATFVLGATSTTDDPEGVVTQMANGEWQIAMEDLQKAMRSFIGEIEQIPPQFAAIKIKGKKMYELAREGKVVEAKPRSITIFAFDLLDLDPLRVRIHCSSGTYIRAIARDLGAKLGVGGYVRELRRTAIGPFTVDEAVTLDQLQRSDWREMLKNLPLAEIKEA